MILYFQCWAKSLQIINYEIGLTFSLGEGSFHGEPR